ncbi:MAG: Tetratricopeptide 2 repeat protein [Myxococcales bacterium]|nr:Tetratricopeptide 2 repeat protein [Myxococcales bacterium]
MDTRTLLRERLRRSRDWTAAIDELEKELEASGTKPEQSERLCELAALVEDVIPERDRAIGLYQRAWKLHPANVRALSRAREVYGEIGRFEMVAKLGEMELRDPNSPSNLAQIVGEAMLDSGQKDKALPVLQRALELAPDSVRVQDALLALDYDPEFWTDLIDGALEKASKLDDAVAIRTLVRAARILRIEAQDDPRLEEILKLIFTKDLEEPSANFIYSSLLAGTQRWDEIEAHHRRRADKAPDHAAKVAALRTFALEWLQRFKDRDRGAKFFAEAVKATASNGATPMKSVVAAFTLLRQVQGDRGEWSSLLDIAESVIDRLTGEDRLYVAIQAGHIAFDKVNDIVRARKFFAIASAVEPQNPNVQDFVEAVGLEDMPAPSAAGSMPGMQAQAPAPADDEPEELPAAAKAKAKKKGKGGAAAAAAEDEEAAAKAKAELEAAKAIADDEGMTSAAAAKETAARAAEEAARAEAEAQLAAQAAAKAAASVAPAPEPAAAALAPGRAKSSTMTKAPVSGDLNEAIASAKSAEAGNDKGVAAWKDVIAKFPTEQAPRRELARVLRTSQAWAQLADALKDEEAKAVTAGPDKASVLLELAEAYGKLNNDNQMISALNGAVQQDPSRLEIYDRLAALYEAKKRWPDLVKVLTEKAERAETQDQKVGIFLQIANLYLEKFSNQAEAIKAFERVLELDAHNQQAIEHLLAVYEKRRDWEKLIKLKEAEVERTPEHERAAKVIDVAKMAATKVKKPEITTFWWEKVLEYDPTFEEALVELSKLYERNKEWDKLADICSRQADAATDDKVRADALQRLGLLYTEKVENSAKAIAAWQRLLAIDENNRRAQDALKKLYVTEGRWTELEDFYRTRGKIDEYIRVLEREVEAGSEQHRLPLAMKIAVLYRDEIQKADRAMRAFEKVLQLDENNLEAAEALIPLYETGRDPRALVRVLEIQLRATAPDDQITRQERIKRLAQYNEEKLRDKGASFGWWIKAFAEDHESEEIRAEAERLAGETGGWSSLLESYAAALPKFAHKADALPLMLVMASIMQEQGDVDAALEMNRQILAIDDGNEQALNALERLYLGKGQFEQLLGIYTKKLDLTNDGDERIAIQSKIGQLYEDEVKDDQKAIAAYQGILDAAGDEPVALRSLDRVYLRNSMWKELADIIGRQLTIVGPDEDKLGHTELKFRLGQVKEKNLDDPQGAIDAYRDILDIMPAHERGRSALEVHLRQGDSNRLTVAGILEPVYEQLGEWGPLVGVHEIQLEAEKDSLRKTSLLLRIGELQRTKLLDAEKAFDAYARAFGVDPATEAAKEQLEAIAALIEDGWARLVALYESALAKGDKDKDLDPRLAHELATKVARSYEDRLGKTDRAVEYYRKALVIEPDDLGALTALEAMFTRDAKYPELLDIYRRRTDIAQEPDERLDFLFRIASLHEEMLENQDEAIATYIEILGQSPDDIKALRALDRLYVARGAWRDLGDNISRQLTLLESPHEQVGLLVRLAQLRETHLNELGAAVETYRQVLDHEEQNRDAVAALERLIGTTEHELTIANILEPIYKARGEWTKQIGVYEIMAKHAFDPARKIELLHQIAELHEIGGDNSESSFATFARAMREDPRNEVTHQQLDRLSRGLSKWADAATLYDQVATDAQEDDLKVALLFRRAQIQEHELRDDKAAVETYERILSAAPGTVEAATAIQTIHARTADYPKLVDVMKRKADILTNVDERKALLYQSAQIEEEVLGNADAAIATFRQVLSIDDVDMVAMDALERLYVKLARWEPLKDVYAKKADLANDPSDKKSMLYVLAQVYDRELGDVGKAIETYLGILDLDADELPAIQSLDRLFGQAERWYDLLANLERQVELSETGGETVALKYRIGHLWQIRLGDVARAIESYREALEMDPSHAETLHALDGLVHGKTEPVMAARVLEPIYETSGEFPKLVDVLEVMVSHNDDPHARVELLHRIATLHEQMIGNAMAAFDAYARALRDDAGNQLTLGHIERLAEITSSFEPLAKLYQAEADKSLDVPRQVDLYSRLARVHEQELADVSKAIATYRKILEVSSDPGDNKPAVLALDRLYSATAQWPELTETLRREIDLADNDAEIATLQNRLGQVLQNQLGDRKGAVDVYREILVAHPTHEQTLASLEEMFHAGHLQMEIGAVLEPLYEAAGEYAKLHGIHEVQLTKLSGPDRSAMYQRLAELAEGRLYDQTKAFTWWSEALVEDPRWDRALEESERLAGETGAWDAQVSAYTRALERTTDKDLKRVTLLRMARVHEFELQDAARAVETHLRVLELETKDADALASLDRLYLAAGMYEDLAEILRRRIEVVQDNDEQLELYFRRGAIFSDALGDLDQALGCYSAVLDQESRNRRALEAIESIHFRREAWQKLFDTYEKLIDVAEADAEMADIYARMARISSEALANEDRAIELWQRVLDIRGEEPMALQALGELCTRRERWEELVEILERQVAVAQTDQEQIRLYKQLGGIWEIKLSRERNALDAWLAADRIDGNDLETLRALAALYRSTQAWDELSQTLRRIIDVGQLTGAVGEGETIELYAQLGQLEGDVLGRVEEAVTAWRHVVAIDPSDFRALAALEGLFTREGRWEEAIDVLEKRALVLDDEAQRRETMLQAASTWEEKVEDLTRAAQVYERVRASDPANKTASDRLEAIYAQQFKWPELVEILLERSELVPVVEEQIQILNRVAKIYEAEIGDQESAFYVLQAAFKRDYSHDQTANELERLASATNRWQELLDEYTNRVNELEREDRGSAADLWVKIGRWYAEHLSHLEYAIHSVQQALRIDPSHTGALGGMGELQRKRGSWSELIETLQRHAAVEPNPEKKTELYIQLADLLERQMQDLGGSIHAYQQALNFGPSSTTVLIALDRLYRRVEQWEPLIEVLNKRASLDTDEQNVVKFRLEVGTIWDLRLYDAGQAITAYNQVLHVDPTNLSALRALEGLYEKTNQSEKYLEVLEAQLDASPSDAERVPLYERMAAAWEERFGKLDRAAEALEKIVAIDNRNYPAYRELARLYQQAGRWEALVETYRNHIMSTSDVQQRVDLYVAMGVIYDSNLQDVDRAVEAYSDVLSFDADEPRALEALGRLYEKISEWDRAIDVMAHLTQLTGDTKKQVDLFFRMGRIQYTQLTDPESAEANLLRALAIDPAHVPTMEALTKQYSDRGDWLKAAQMMVRAESYTAVALDKVRLLFEAANIYQYKLRQDDQAKALYAAVISLDPEHVEAGRPLAELYFNDRQWTELSPVIDMLARKVGQLHADPKELNELYFRAAKTADELGDFQRALGYYKAAYDIDSTYLPTLTGRADLLFKMGDFDNAGKIYQTILVQHRDGQDEADVVRIYNRLGAVRQALGERKKALNMFEKALEINPNHRETLNAVIELQTQQGDWEAVVHAKRGLINTANEKEKVELLDQIATIYHDKLQNPQKSIAAYQDALEVSPEDHQLLQKVLDLYTEQKQWKKVVETIDRFIALESDTVRKGAYLHASATIYRDELKSLDEAVDYYNKALDSFFANPAKLPEAMIPRALKSFEAIDKVLTTKRDWKGQERAYRDMVKRMPKEVSPTFHKIQVGLFDGLGEIYRSRLKHYQSATQAYEIAQQLDPKNELRADGTDRAEILAELYLVAGPDYTDKAIEQHMRMLRNEPFKYDSYKALRRIYMDAHQYDKTWCVCNTLAFLKKADPDELQFYEQYKPRGLVKAKNVMSPDTWAKLVHPDENRYISAIFGASWQGVAAMKAFPHKDFGIKRKDKRQLPGDPLMFSKLFYYVAQVLNVPLPEVFLLEDNKPADIQLANAIEKNELCPSFVVRPHLLQGKSEREIAFLSARRLTFMRPEYYLKMLLPTNTELKVVVLTAIVMVQPRFPVPPDMAQLVQQYLPEMQKRMPPQVIEQLGAVVSRFIQAAPEINLAKWGHAVDAVSHRAGFVVCGDLEVAARMVSAEPVTVGGPQVKDKIKELVLYSISEDFFTVRAQMGLTIAG